jgi:hypothetical protein
MSQPSVATGTILDRIMARTAADLAARANHVPVRDLERAIHRLPTPVSLTNALNGPSTWPAAPRRSPV